MHGQQPQSLVPCFIIARYPSSLPLPGVSDRRTHTTAVLLFGDHTASDVLACRLIYENVTLMISTLASLLAPSLMYLWIAKIKCIRLSHGRDFSDLSFHR